MIAVKKLIVVVVVSLIAGVEMSQEIMKKMSINFTKPMALCKKELDLSDAVIAEFNNFWKEGYVLKDPQTGCAIMCLSAKLNLLDPEYNLHHGNAQEFAKQHGADDALAKQLVDMIHDCIGSTPAMPDPCSKTLAVAQCFKNKIHELDWAPSMDIIVGEVLAEI